jgi:hypothetical protein
VHDRKSLIHDLTPHCGAHDPTLAKEFHMTRLIAGAFATLVLAAPSLAQAQNPMMAAIKAQHDQIKGYILKSAAVVP